MAMHPDTFLKQKGNYRDAIAERKPDTIANIAITLIHQTDVFLRKLIERLQQDFVKGGGIREQMTRARIDYRNKTNKTDKTN